MRKTFIIVGKECQVCSAPRSRKKWGASVERVDTGLFIFELPTFFSLWMEKKIKRESQEDYLRSLGKSQADPALIPRASGSSVLNLQDTVLVGFFLH